jgi:sensor domain CHASE-containing protein
MLKGEMQSTIIGIIITVIVVILIVTFIYMSYNNENKLTQTTLTSTEFVLESKVKINIPELEDCTLYTLTYETIAWPIRVIRCANSIST